MDRFESKLRAEIDAAHDRIEKERVRIAVLEQALTLYLENRPRQRAAGTAEPSPTTKFGFVLDCIKKAGPRGLTVQEMVDAAEKANIEVKRNTIRSQLWHAKERRQLTRTSDGRYRLASPASSKDEAPGSDEPSASSHNGDGGGTPSSSGSREPTLTLAARPGAIPAHAEE